LKGNCTPHIDDNHISRIQKRAKGVTQLARLTFKFDENLSSFSGPKALGSLVVKYWEDSRGKSPEEIEKLALEMKSQMELLFDQTQDGSVNIKLVHDDPNTVHIAIPVPADDLTKYHQEGFDEAFGNTIVFGCGRVQPIRMVSQTDTKIRPISRFAKSRKVA
jgi:hypothetical protein